MKLKKLTALAVICANLITTSAFASESYEYYDTITNIVSNIYIDADYTKTDIVNKGLEKLISENPQLAIELLKASLESLDEYSEFFTAEEMKSYVNALNNTIYGIGVVITTKGDYVTVERCVDGGSAQKAGLQVGDKIIRIDGVDVTGNSTGKVKTYLLGELNSEVSVTVLRGEEEITYNMQRCEVHDITVSASILKNDIGYIKVKSFSIDTDKEFEEALNKLRSENIKKVIIDLRDNPGGYTDAAIKMAEQIVPEGVIIKTEFRNNEANRVYESKLKTKEFDFCLLVNENTASSAEIFASAVQDSGAGVLVGEKTYGKGVIQNMLSLPGGMGMKITTGKYLTRNGDEINNVGIKPDHKVVNEIQMYDTSSLTAMDYKTKWNVGDNNECIIGAKQRLLLLGYNVNYLDSEYTEEEKAEVERFQSDMGMYPYGVLDITTQTRLENEVHKLDQEIDNQFMYAYKYFGGETEGDIQE